MPSVFDGVPDWPEKKANGQQPRDPRYDNEPPLEERLLLEFQNDLDAEGITGRIQELIDSAQRVPEMIENDAVAGKVGDLCKLASDVQKRVEAAREKHNRPLLNAQRSLKSRADTALHPLQAAIASVRNRLNSYMQEKARLAAEAQRKADEETRRLQDEANAKASLPEYAPRVERPIIEKPVARGDLGAKVGTRKVKHHEIESVRQLPDRLLKHPTVLEALNRVIAAEIRAGAKEIKGVRIWETDEAVVR